MKHSRSKPPRALRAFMLTFRPDATRTRGGPTNPIVHLAYRPGYSYADSKMQPRRSSRLWTSVSISRQSARANAFNRPQYLDNTTPCRKRCGRRTIFWSSNGEIISFIFAEAVLRSGAAWSLRFPLHGVMW